ncbi:hypothetical protein BDY19DRAFT_975515 [Irpex rosettiformis]|uniref:Uncharacterized protein n=1 Tax=Irpex rosettiformis TaxID=378272 RepID=A0ACB8TPE0_9APHY|nr:hypothetical protein BDY19DRAFT_975515 [Irpex rosettiformis]
MRFTLPFVTAATVFGLASSNPILETRQEALRFGTVDVNPTTVKLGQQFNVLYNNTQGRFVPRTLEVYINGKYPNGFVTPSIQLERTDLLEEEKYYTFNTTLPIISNDDTEGYVAEGAYTVSAFITYTTKTGAISRGGVETPINIDLSN